MATADFNGDGKPDYVLYRASTRQTALWYLDNNVLIGGDLGPTLPSGWALVGVADFDGDGHPDYALFHPDTGYSAIFYLSGAALVGAAWGPTLPSGWALVGTADFDGDTELRDKFQGPSRCGGDEAAGKSERLERRAWFLYCAGKE